MARAPKINIINGVLKFEFNRKDIIEIKQSHDGIVINLRESTHICFTDPNMPLETKRVITTSFDNYKTTDLVINVRNYIKPVVAKPIID